MNPEKQTETLEVKNFAGLRDIKITLSDINLFIGPQASGKSIIAKLLYYFKSWFWKMIVPVTENTEHPGMQHVLLKRFEEFFPPTSWSPKASFSVRYGVGTEFMEVTLDKGERPLPQLNFSPRFTKILEEMERPRTKVDNQSDLKERRHAALAADLKVIFSENNNPAVLRQYYIPAGRSFFAYLQQIVFTLLARGLVPTDPFLKDFGATYEEFRNSHGPGGSHVIPDVERLVQEILCGRYVNLDGEDIIVQPDGRRVDLAHSSSGQQEALPVTIMLSALLWAGRCNCYLEEPEAHIFPSAQKKMVDLIGTVFNLTEKQVHFTLTTHSPYILTAFNNLLQAGSLAERFDKGKDVKRLKALDRLVPKNRWLNPNQVAAYFVADGKAESIMDKETGLIDATAIDSVSDEIAVEFDKLLEL